MEQKSILTFGRRRHLALIAAIVGLAGRVGERTDFENDPDLFTHTEEIPERPGLIQNLTGRGSVTFSF